MLNSYEDNSDRKSHSATVHNLKDSLFLHLTTNNINAAESDNVLLETIFAYLFLHKTFTKNTLLLEWGPHKSHIISKYFTSY